MYFCAANERKALSHDLLELKNKELSENTENVSPNKNNNEEQVRNLLKVQYEIVAADKILKVY